MRHFRTLADATLRRQGEDAFVRLPHTDEEPASLRFPEPGSMVMAMKRAAASLVLAAALTGCSVFQSEIDLQKVETGIENWARDFAVGPVSADCGDRTVPAEANYTFICDITDSTGSASVRVTVLNDNGDVEWEILG